MDDSFSLDGSSFGWLQLVKTDIEKAAKTVNKKALLCFILICSFVPLYFSNKSLERQIKTINSLFLLYKKE